MARAWQHGEKMNATVPVVVLAPGDHGHGIARSLGRLGVPMYGVHADVRSAAAQSRYWRQTFRWDISTAPAAASVDWLLELSRTLGVRPLLIPTDDSGCLLVADYADVLREGYLFPAQPAGLARALSNKQHMDALCRQHAIPTAATFFPRSRDELGALLPQITFPVIVKVIDGAIVGRRARGTKVIASDAAALLRYYDALETPAANLLVQECIPGDDTAVWMFNGYFDAQARCLFGLTGQKIRQSPPYKGVTSLGVCVANATVVAQTEAFMGALGYRGILDIGYKFDARDGQYKLLDVNPRIGATFRLFVDRAGLDVARALYCDLTGQPVRPGAAPEGRKWVVEPADLMSSAAYVRDGKVRLREWVSSYHGIEEASWFAWDDLRPCGAVWVRLAQRARTRASVAIRAALPMSPAARTPSMVARASTKDAFPPPPVAAPQRSGTIAGPPPSSLGHQQRIDAHFTAVAQYWTDIYAEQSLRGAIHQDRRALALRWIDELALPPESCILEIGCGAGLLAVELAMRGHRVEAIDTSEGMVDLARAHAAAAGVSGRLTVSLGDAHTLPFPPDAYDVVIALGVVPFLHAPRQALAEMARVVRPEGVILLSSDNRWRLNHVLDPRISPVLSPARRLTKQLLPGLAGPPTTWRTTLLSTAGLERLLASAGLRPTRCVTLGFGPFSFMRQEVVPEVVAMRLHRQLQRWADSRLPVLRSTGAQHVVLAVPSAGRHAHARASTPRSTSRGHVPTTADESVPAR